MSEHIQIALLVLGVQAVPKFLRWAALALWDWRTHWPAFHEHYCPRWSLDRTEPCRCGPRKVIEAVWRGWREYRHAKKREKLAAAALLLPVLLLALTACLPGTGRYGGEPECTSAVDRATQHDDSFVWLDYYPTQQTACAVESGPFDAGTGIPITHRGEAKGDADGYLCTAKADEDDEWLFDVDGGIATATSVGKRDTGAVVALRCRYFDGGQWP